MNKQPMQILFDADMVVFRATSACEREITWYPDFSTLHCDHNEAKTIVDDTVARITEKVLRHYSYEGNYEIIMCFSDDTNFRKKILPTYKLNRMGKRKPLGYLGVKQWVSENYTCYQRQSLEADDCIGILATLKGTKSVIISGDKDFKSIPGSFYNLISDTFVETSQEEADYNHLYQTLVGDTADNYKGCPGLGAVGAKKLLDQSATWGTVVRAFEKKGLTESEALIQARVARILRAEDYDFKAKKPILWTPKCHI